MNAQDTLDINVFRKAVVDHARYLGIDPEKEKDFLWLAEEALLAQLPDDWEIYNIEESAENENGQNYYYYNKNTGQCSWENPLDEPYRQLFQKLKNEKGNHPPKDTRAPTVVALNSNSLPLNNNNLNSVPPPRPPQPEDEENGGERNRQGNVNVNASAIPTANDYHENKLENDNDEFIAEILGHRTSVTGNGKEFEYLVRWATPNSNACNILDDLDSQGNGNLEWFLADVLWADHKTLINEYNSKNGINRQSPSTDILSSPSQHPLKKGYGKDCETKSPAVNTMPVEIPWRNLNKGFDNSADNAEKENLEKKMEQLERINNEKEKEIAQLEADLKHHKELAVKLQSESKQIRNEIESKTSERLEGLAKLHQNELEGRDKELSSFREKEKKHFLQIQNVENEKRVLVNQNQTLQESIQGLEANQQKLLSELEAEKARSEDISLQMKEAAKSYRDRESKSSETEGKVMQLKETIESLQRQKSRIENDKQFLDGMLNNLKKELDSELSINLGLRQDLAESSIELDQTKREVQRLNEDLVRFRQVEEEYNKIMNQLEQTKAECKLMNEKNTLLLEQVERYEQENSKDSDATVAKDISKLENELSKLTAELESTQSERNALQGSLNTARMALVESQDEVSKLNSKLMSFKEKCEAGDRRTNRLESEQRLLETALQRVKSELESELKSNETLRQKISRIEDEHVVEVRSLRSNEREGKLNSESNIRKLEVDLELACAKQLDAENQLESARKKLQDSMKEIQKRNESESQLEAEVVELKVGLSDMKAALDTANDTNNNLKTDMSAYKVKLQEKEKELDQINSDVLTQREEVDEAKRSKDRAESQLRLLEQKLKGETEANSSLHASIQELETKLEGLQNASNSESSRLRTDCNKFEAELASAKEEESALKLKINDLVTETGHLKKCLLEEKKKSEEMENCLNREKKKSEDMELKNNNKEDESRRLQLEKALSRCKEEMEIALQARTKQMELEKESALNKLRQDLEQKHSQNSAVVEELEILRPKYEKERRLRRQLHNKVVDLQGNIRVYCRMRPVLSHELKTNRSAIAFECDPEGGQISLTNVKSNLLREQDESYEFDQVFGQKSTQEQVFSHVEPLATSVLDGYNVCIFAYGQTGTGKTYTMDGDIENPGVNSRTLESIFQLIKENSENPGNIISTFTVKLSMLEIYNETIKDLLLNGDVKSQRKLEIRSGEEGLYVPGLNEVEVNSMEDVKSQLKVGRKNRTVGAHNINQHSSRSHLVVTVTVIHKKRKKSSNQVDENSEGKVFRGKLHLIDLAGSERINKTEATGARLKEAKSINKSLSALGNVIQALGSKDKKKHVPFRDSKLTYLLQESLSGNSKVLMFVNVSPVEFNLQESLCSLKFAQRCGTVSLGQAKKNTESSEVAALKQTIESLRGKLR